MNEYGILNLNSVNLFWIQTKWIHCHHWHTATNSFCLKAFMN